MDRKTKMKVLEALKSMIMKATDARVEIYYGHEEAIDQYTGYPRVAHNGQIDIHIEIYVKEIDGRKELWASCSAEEIRC